MVCGFSVRMLISPYGLNFYNCLEEGNSQSIVKKNFSCKRCRHYELTIHKSLISNDNCTYPFVFRVI